MAEVREPGGLGYKVITVLGILFFLVVVAVLIRSYDDDDAEVSAAGPVATTPAPNPSLQAPTEVPVGAVATGGGGTAVDGSGAVLPVVVALTALTMLAAAGMAVLRRTA